MSSATTQSQASGSQPQSREGSPLRSSARNPNQPSLLYTMVMTPLNFVTFLFSLVLIDLRYTLMRSHNRSGGPSRLPDWLYAIIYREQPYESRPRRGAGRKAKNKNEEQWHYHTMQKKLLKMEADEAFRFRNSFILLLGLAAAGGAVGSVYLTQKLWRSWISA